MLQAVRQNIGNTKDRIQEAEDLAANLEKAIAVISSISEARQSKLQNQLEALITRGLQTIFQEDMRFSIESKTQGKLHAMDLKITSTLNGQDVTTDIINARGGGVAAVTGFLIRLVILLLMKRDTDPFLILDESFAQVSEEYAPRLAEFIKELTEKTNVQIIMVTHSDGYAESADTHYRVSKKNGLTQAALAT